MIQTSSGLPLSTRRHAVKLITATLGSSLNCFAAASDENIRNVPKGILYRVVKGETINHLFGLIHIGRKDFYPLPRVINDAIGSSQSVAVEIDVLSSAMSSIFQSLGMLTEGNVSAILSQADWDSLVKLTTALDRPDLLRMKPGVLSLVIETLNSRQCDLSSNYSVDSYLLGFARARKKPVIELEGLQRQLAMFDDINLSQQGKMVSNALRNYETGIGAQQLNRITAAWCDGDEKGLAEEIGIDRRSASELDVLVFDRLFTRRNKFFLGRLLNMPANQSWFAGIGAGHLLGKNGVVAGMADAGYQCRRIDV